MFTVKSVIEIRIPDVERRREAQRIDGLNPSLTLKLLPILPLLNRLTTQYGNPPIPCSLFKNIFPAEHNWFPSSLVLISDMVILLVEDNEDDVVLFRMAFKKANVPARLQIVSDGEEAVAYLQCQRSFTGSVFGGYSTFLDLSYSRLWKWVWMCSVVIVLVRGSCSSLGNAPRP